MDTFIDVVLFYTIVSAGVRITVLMISLTIHRLNQPAGWTTRELRSDSLGGRIWSDYHHVHTGSGAHQVSYPLGTAGSSSRCKAVEREVDSSPSYNVAVKNTWSSTSNPHTSS